MGIPMKRSRFLTVFSMTLVMFAGGCKKDSNPAQNSANNNTSNCNFTTDVVVVDGVSRNIVQTNANALGAGFIVEFLTDNSASPTGIALLFSSSSSPAAGDYAFESDATQVTAGKVYVEYYDPTTAWRGISGTAKVAMSGAQKVITFCLTELVATPTNKKIVSVRGTMN